MTSILRHSTLMAGIMVLLGFQSLAQAESTKYKVDQTDEGRCYLRNSEDKSEKGVRIKDLYQYAHQKSVASEAKFLTWTLFGNSYYNEKYEDETDRVMPKFIPDIKAKGRCKILEMYAKSLNKGLNKNNKHKKTDSSEDENPQPYDKADYNNLSCHNETTKVQFKINKDGKMYFMLFKKGADDEKYKYIGYNNLNDAAKIQTNADSEDCKIKVLYDEDSKFRLCLPTELARDSEDEFTANLSTSLSLENLGKFKRSNSEMSCRAGRTFRENRSVVKAFKKFDDSENVKDDELYDENSDEPVDSNDTLDNEEDNGGTEDLSSESPDEEGRIEDTFLNGGFRFHIRNA